MYYIQKYLVQADQHGSSELFCFSCKRTQSELDRRKKKGTKGTAFAGGVVLRHLDRVGWFCVAHAKKARSAQAEAAAAGSPPRQSSVSGSSSPSSHSPVVKPMRRPKRPLLPGDTGRIDGYAKRLADDVSMEVGRSADPDAVAAAIGSSLAARMPQLLPGAENGRVALAIIEESIAPVLGGMACAAPRGGNVPTDVRGASEAAAMLVGAVKSVPGHVVANLLGGMVNDSAAGQAAMARVAATSKPGAAEWSSVAAVSRQLSRGRQKRKASPSALSSFAPKPRVRATTFKNLHLAIAVVAAVFIKLSSCTGVRCAWPLNLTAILLLLPIAAPCRCSCCCCCSCSLCLIRAWWRLAECVPPLARRDANRLPPGMRHSKEEASRLIAYNLSNPNLANPPKFLMGSGGDPVLPLQQEPNDARRRRNVLRFGASGDAVHAELAKPEQMAALAAAGCLKRPCLSLVYWVHRTYLWWIKPLDRTCRETCCCYTCFGMKFAVGRLAALLEETGLTVSTLLDELLCARREIQFGGGTANGGTTAMVHGDKCLRSSCTACDAKGAPADRTPTVCMHTLCPENAVSLCSMLINDDSRSPMTAGVLKVDRGPTQRKDSLDGLQNGQRG